MASDLTLEFAGVEMIEGSRSGDILFGSPGWRVAFIVKAPRVTYDAAVFVEVDCPKEDIVRRAMHRFHLQMAELVQETAGWRLPQAE